MKNGWEVSKVQAATTNPCGLKLEPTADLRAALVRQEGDFTSMFKLDVHKIERNW